MSSLDGADCARTPIASRCDGDVGFVGSALYWERRYAEGGTSGAGSYQRLATFKADFLNAFVRDHGVTSVIEFGSGDGAQLSLAEYPSYLGVDVSPTAIEMCRRRFAQDGAKTFALASDAVGLTAELSLSLDVIFHLIEDDVYVNYMASLFQAAGRFVIVYSSDVDAPGPAPHVRHRCFSDWVARNATEWRLVHCRRHDFPFDERDPDQTSYSDFFVFARAS